MKFSRAKMLHHNIKEGNSSQDSADRTVRAVVNLFAQER